MEYIAKYNRLHDKKRMKAKLEKHFDNVDITGRGKNINIELGERTLYISMILCIMSYIQTPFIIYAYTCKEQQTKYTIINIITLVVMYC